MRFVKSEHVARLLAATAVMPKDLQIDNSTNIRGVARTLATQAMTYYTGTETKYVDLAQPMYWWQAGALFGAMMDYSHLTGDTTYDKVIRTALIEQRGPQNDLNTTNHANQMGNDDIAVWSLGILAAAERNFAQKPNTATEIFPSWLSLADGVFKAFVGRWDETACNGGLFWQVYASNPNGVDYKNTIANGGFFQLAARLYRLTGKKEYADWATKIWDWTWKVKMIDHAGYYIFDGASAKEKCAKVTDHGFTYTMGIYLYGAAVMANVTNDQLWLDRAGKIATATNDRYVNHGPDGTKGVLYESACEPIDGCNKDMTFHKGIASRFFWQAGLLVPSLRQTLEDMMRITAQGAASACVGGPTGKECGVKWTINKFEINKKEGNTGLGEVMSVLDAVQGLLVGQGLAKPILTKAQIKDVRLPA